MKTDTKGKFWRSRMALIASVSTLMLLTGGGAALADGDDDFSIVSGNSVFSDCGLPGSDFALEMSGDLEGCLSVFVKRFRCKELNGYDGYWESGRETFVGTLHGKRGKFRTRYIFDAAYAPGYCKSLEMNAPDPSLEVGGGCIHEVWGRSGVFRHAEGEIKFIDVITGVTGDPVDGSYSPGFGANNFLYLGHLRLDDNAH